MEASTAVTRHGFSVNRIFAGSAVGWSTRGRTAILDQLRRNMETDAKPWGMPTVAALADAVLHGLDVRRPLGLAQHVPPAALESIARFSLATRWPLNAVVGGSARRRLDGVRLVASDADWSYGKGAEARAPSVAIALLFYGRAPRVDELEGPGAETLADRL